jgi:hypothetical protein
MEAVQIAPSRRAAAITPKLRYNSFLPNNRRREALEELEEFINSERQLNQVTKWFCHDDLAAIVEMMIEERRSMNRFTSPIENAELV